MGFETLFKTISPRLKRIARSHNGHGFFIDENDLYQEMCIHLWDNFRNGVPITMNCAYIIKNCEFYILNYIRKKREKATIVSLEKSLDDSGGTLKDVLPDTNEPLDRCVDRKITIDSIRNNGFSKRGKEVFSLLAEGYTVREVGKKLGISHVRVVKIKKRIIENWQKKLK